MSHLHVLMECLMAEAMDNTIRLACIEINL